MFPWSRKPSLVLTLNETFSWRELVVTPTNAGFWLLFLTIAVWFGALNYAISLAYALAFWLFSFLIISLLMVRQQLVGLKITRIECGEVFAGDGATVTMTFGTDNKKGRVFYVIYDDISTLVQMQDQEEIQITLNLPTYHRGYLPLPEIILFTDGPFGLMKTHMTLELDERVLVYPHPLKQDLFQAEQLGSEEGNMSVKGEDDLSFLIEHEPGQSPRLIAWKTYAKTGKLLDKRFETEFSSNPKMISYRDYPAGTSIEQMASFMCQLVLDAEQAAQVYTVELPNQIISLQPNQRGVVLTALGLWV